MLHTIQVGIFSQRTLLAPLAYVGELTIETVYYANISSHVVGELTLETIYIL